jgi:hypothetical protein
MEFVLLVLLVFCFFGMDTYLEYRKDMAMIKAGLNPDEEEEERD